MLGSIKIIQWFSKKNKIQKCGTLIFGSFNTVMLNWTPTGYYNLGGLKSALNIFIYIKTFITYLFENTLLKKETLLRTPLIKF